MTNRKGYMSSQEQIFSPIETKKEKNTSEDGPCFLEPTNKVSIGKFSKNHVCPTSNDLDPFFKPEKHDFNVAITNSEKELNLQIGQGGESPEDEELDEEKENKEKITEVRTIGLRGPLLLSGWSYTLPGFSSPNDGASPYFFPEDYSVNRKKFRTGPVDLRWDEERKVYTCGMDIIEGYLNTPITKINQNTLEPTTFTMRVCRCRDLDIETKSINGTVDDWGSTGETIIGVNRSTTLKAVAGSYIIVARINYEYRPIWVDC